MARPGFFRMAAMIGRFVKKKYFAEKWSPETAPTSADFAKNILESLKLVAKVTVF
jgi:hypothetical protein